ncbi:TPA: hypothetical protein QDB08_003635 [Burkholderia vietnamiensis]|uniref:hypothetical protein n=1 Tax=Burkholderia vietnamiensis TaxID=60552 RepID=UPI0015933FC3|nr:hypothetical protein [Burkholderia vietnamiensis]MBR8087648.1 hypothetical protein [Burkholderia vietnamiensis]MBR8188693.1 hypothetical protein [Burkholderia vietnamiensis]MDN7819685.1 hypothetical protein [Burkholderia vietnamiensis]HDR9010647.1 hypothetical protein [Burkholderia vietnamiensis]HDR9019026.1 hypothetical protein [Burkholderia vietnamiensis]
MKKENAQPSNAELSAVEQRQLTALTLHQSRGESRVDSRVLAEHLGNSHKHVRELLEIRLERSVVKVREKIR